MGSTHLEVFEVKITVSAVLASIAALLLFGVPAGAQVPDTTAPVVTCGTSDGSWHGADVSIACSASDSDSGLANPADANFSLATSVPTGTETANAGTGSRQVCDLAGNCSPAGPIMGNMVDKKRPSVSCAGMGAGWHRTDVSYACTASDAGSGLANPSAASFTLRTHVPSGTETPNARTNVVQRCDVVGNCVTRGPIGGNKVDKRGPRNPTAASSSHRRLRWSADRTITVIVRSAFDGGSGVDGFSIAWTRSPTTSPDRVRDRQQWVRRMTSRRLGNGRWFFHLRTRDNVGHWSAPLHRGPFLIDGTAPRARALSSSGRVNRVVRLKYRVSDNSGKTREKITVFRNRVKVRTIRTGMSTSTAGVTYWVGFRPGSTDGYRFCVQAWDRAGNRSRLDCAGLRITRPRPVQSCQAGYSPCLPIVFDLDCADIPESKKPVRVTGSDPYRLDADNDGWGCEPY
jgi:hypothetical protein